MLKAHEDIHAWIDAVALSGTVWNRIKPEKEETSPKPMISSAFCSLFLLLVCSDSFAVFSMHSSFILSRPVDDNMILPEPR